MPLHVPWLSVRLRCVVVVRIVFLLPGCGTGWCTRAIRHTYCAVGPVMWPVGSLSLVDVVSVVSLFLRLQVRCSLCSDFLSSSCSCFLLMLLLSVFSVRFRPRVSPSVRLHHSSVRLCRPAPSIAAMPSRYPGPAFSPALLPPLGVRLPFVDLVRCGGPSVADCWCWTSFGVGDLRSFCLAR